ncbi:MAG: outer membrane protein assembly factor BamC [Porticoccus sp.]|nr:outer membrane protein assembly factor BamC [Porticoccus sp.]
MMSKMKLMVVIAAALSIVGCDQNLIRNHSNDYLDAEEIPSMDIPDDMDKTAVGQLYPVPEITLLGDSPETFNVPRPQPLSENLFEETVAIQTFGEKHWISINKPPAEVWPRVRNVLTRGGVPTERVDAQSGVLETGWLQFKDEENVSHRFRFTIAPGVGIKSAEIWLVHMQVTQGDEAKAGDWPEISVSEARDNEFTQMLADALVNDINSGSVSLLAQDIGGESRVDVVTPEEDAPYISIDLNYDRAWISVIHSLSLGGFSVVDKNQSAGTVIVEFDDAPIVSEDTSLIGVVSALFEGDEEEQPALQYQVRMIQNEQVVEIRINDRQNGSLDRGQATKLLKVIRSNLS